MCDFDQGSGPPFPHLSNGANDAHLSYRLVVMSLQGNRKDLSRPWTTVQVALGSRPRRRMLMDSLAPCALLLPEWVPMARKGHRGSEGDHFFPAPAAVGYCCHGLMGLLPSRGRFWEGKKQKQKTKPTVASSGQCIRSPVCTCRLPPSGTPCA